MHVITLLHGTFAPNAGWTKPTSPLREHLTRSLPGKIEFVLFPWSGANRNSDRLTAATELAKVLHSNIAAHPDARHYIIAHSHGGNVALYALRDEALQNRINGVICMNTPFLTMTRRDAEQVAFALNALFAGEMVAWLIAVATLGVFAGNWLDSMLTFIFAAIAVAGTLWLTRFRSTTKNWLVKQRERYIAATAVPIIKKPTIHCLWSASDEVFTLFNALEGIVSIPYLLTNIYFVALLLIYATVIPFFGYMPHGYPLGALAPFNNRLDFFDIVLVFMFMPFVFTLQMLTCLMLLGITLNFFLRIIPMGLPWKGVISTTFV